jgi:hypothetical protein
MEAAVQHQSVADPWAIGRGFDDNMRDIEA